jgi:hypothetical protein
MAESAAKVLQGSLTVFYLYLACFTSSGLFIAHVYTYLRCASKATFCLNLSILYRPSWPFEPV